MPVSRHPAVTLVVAFLLGAAVGGGLVWLLGEPTRGGPGDELPLESPTREGPPAAPELVVRASPSRPAPGEPGTGDGTAPASTGRAAGSAAAPEQAGAGPGWIEVRIAQPKTGPPISALAYVLPAGSPGGDDEDLVPHGYPEEERPLRLQVPQPGLYDVGLTWQGHTLMHEDVRVAAGATVPLAFEPTVGRPVALRLGGIFPPHPEGTVFAQVALQRVSSRPSRWVPGRGEARTHVWIADWRSGTLRIGDLLSHERAKVSVSLSVETETPAPGRKPLLTHVATCRPSQVGAGDEVTVEVLPAARLEVEVALAPEEWPEGVVRRLRVILTSAAGEQAQSVPVRAPWKARQGVYGPLGFRVPAGLATLRWEGDAVEPGKIQEIELTAEKTTRIRIAPKFGGASALRRSLRVEVEVPDVVKQADYDYGVMLGGVVPDAGEGLVADTWAFDPFDDGVQEFFSRIRGAERLIAVSGPDWASEPAAVPERGGVRLTLRPGGQLVVVLETEPPEGAGTLRLRRKDGLPIYSLDKEEFRRVMPLETGLRLGPFLPGTVEFEVLRGLTPSGEVRATVRAGRSTPLLIR